MTRILIVVLTLGVSSLILDSSAFALNHLPKFTSCTPDSDFLGDDPTAELDPAFCSQWNPEFSFNGHRCCSKPRRVRRRSLGACAPERRKSSRCEEMTEEQKIYSEKVSSGAIKDVLAILTEEMGRRGDQANCAVSSGFLAWGRRLIPSEQNRIQLRMASRCTEFGTDSMIGMLEWAGRQVSKRYADSDYKGVRLIVGDISAPRGGCLSGRFGRRGHASHTTGQDVDLGYLTVKAKSDSPLHFHQQFDPAANWWLIKQIFTNPFGCVKVIFLDKRHISKLRKYAKDDEDWDKYQRFIRHVRGHRHHFHIRVGEGPGLPGCASDAHPELETEEVVDTSDEIVLPASQSTNIEE